MLGYIATHAMNPSLQKLRYDPVKDFEPVGMVGSSATLMVVNPAVKANNAKELVALLKAAPDKISYASAGNGTAPHFAAEMFKLVDGHQHAARALQGIGAGDHRHHRRPDAGDVPQPLHRHSLREGRQAEGRSAWPEPSGRR